MTYQEQVAPDEDTRFAAFAAELRALQVRLDGKHGKGRALHRKQTAGLEGTLEVRSGLPPELAVGPFAEPRAYRAFARFSNGGAGHERDATPDLRGFAVKLLGVDGPKVLGDARTQDLLTISAPVQPFRDPDEFVRFLKIARAGSPAALPIRMVREFGPLSGLSLLRRLVAATRAPASFATARWYSAAPIRWGATAARYALLPVDPPEVPKPATRGPDHYADDLRERLARGPLRFDLAVQTYVDEPTTPIEDASRDWPTPYTPVARLELPAVDLGSERAKRVAAFVESLSFDPWHAVEELRPLGAVMRARKHAYFASLTERGARAEPTGDESFD